MGRITKVVQVTVDKEIEMYECDSCGIVEDKRIRDNKVSVHYSEYPNRWRIIGMSPCMVIVCDKCCDAFTVSEIIQRVEEARLAKAEEDKRKIF